MMRFRNSNIIILAILLMSACAPEAPTLDSEQPSIMSISPGSLLKAQEAALEITLSKPVLTDRKLEGCFLLAKSAAFSTAQIERIAKAKSTRSLTKFVSIHATLSENKLQITALDTLEFDESYSLWVFDCFHDQAGNALRLGETDTPYLEFQFRSEPGPQTQNVQADVVISEILASKSSEEFIELVNYGDASIDLARFTLVVDGKKCALSKAKKAIMLEPLSKILLVGKKFDLSTLGPDDTNRLHRMSGQALCGNLQNWPLPRIAILDEQGVTVDEFNGMLEPKEAGHSIKRLNPPSKNGKQEWGYFLRNVHVRS